MIPSTPRTPLATMTPFPTGPDTPPSEPDPSDPDPAEPDPSQPELPSTPEETPFTEPRHYPIHPDIPLQPIHENDPTRCGSVTTPHPPRRHGR